MNRITLGQYSEEITNQSRLIMAKMAKFITRNSNAFIGSPTVIEYELVLQNGDDLTLTTATYSMGIPSVLTGLIEDASRHADDISSITIILDAHRNRMTMTINGMLLPFEGTATRQSRYPKLEYPHILARAILVINGDRLLYLFCK